MFSRFFFIKINWKCSFDPFWLFFSFCRRIAKTTSGSWRKRRRGGYCCAERMLSGRCAVSIIYSVEITRWKRKNRDRLSVRMILVTIQRLFMLVSDGFNLTRSRSQRTRAFENYCYYYYSTVRLLLTFRNFALCAVKCELIPKNILLNFEFTQKYYLCT